ncbi:MAG: hypothetical protein ACE366_13760 [Bradymonadia bacterium]
MDTRARVAELLAEILEHVTGGLEAEPDLPLGSLELGFEGLIACTGRAFGLPEGWVGNGEAVNDTFDVMVDHVAAYWDGATVNEDWPDLSEL